MPDPPNIGLKLRIESVLFSWLNYVIKTLDSTESSTVNYVSQQHNIKVLRSAVMLCQSAYRAKETMRNFS